MPGIRYRCRERRGRGGNTEMYVGDIYARCCPTAVVVVKVNAPQLRRRRRSTDSVPEYVVGSEGECNPKREMHAWRNASTDTKERDKEDKKA